MSFSHRYPAVLALAAAWLVPAKSVLAADASVPVADPIVVSATRLPTPVSEVASSVTVITAQEIEQRQLRTLPDVLREVPGVNVVQYGGAGGTSMVFMRGTNNNHTKVLVDGIDVSDPSTSTGTFDFSQVQTGDIARIEVLRGPQSGLYGSDAIGGVISITTKKGDGPARFTGSVEGGSFGTFNQTAGAAGSAGRFDYAFNLIHNRSTSVPVTPLGALAPGVKRVDDLSDSRTFSTKLGAELSDTLDVGLVARATETELLNTNDHYDVGLAREVPDSVHSFNNNREYFTRGTIHQDLFDGVFDHTAGVTYSSYRRRATDFNAAPSEVAYYRGTRVKADWVGNVRVAAGETVTVGAETQRDTLNDGGLAFGADNTASARATNSAGFVQLLSDWNKRLENAVSLRYDDHSLFGGKATYREAPAVLIPETGTKLKASVGTGFKAPSLDQLYHTYDWGFGSHSFANPNLQPEQSLGFDGGFEQKLGGVSTGVTYFSNTIKNLIESVELPSFDYVYRNVSRAKTQGFETFAAYDPAANVSLRGDYTYTLAENAETHESLARRPKHKASLTSTWRATEALAVSATVIMSGDWVDVGREGGPKFKASGYTTANLAANYTLSDNLALFGRVTNLLDRHVENPVGFEQPGIGAFAGIRVSY